MVSRLRNGDRRRAIPRVPEVAVYERSPLHARSRPGAGLRRRFVHLLLDAALCLVPRDRDGLLLIALVRHWREDRRERPLNRAEPNVRAGG